MCFSQETLSTRVTQLKHHLLNRGYPAKIIDEQIQKAVSVPRSEALQYQEKKSGNRIPFVVTYHPTHSTIASTIHKYLPILHTSSRCKEAIPEPPMVAFRRATNIKDLVVRSSLKAPSAEATNMGFSPCKQCTACKHQHGEHRIQHTVSINSITSTTTGENFTIRHSLNCLTNDITYVITCKRCSQQYVGETKRTLKQRRLEHCGDAKNKREKPVARHCNLPGHLRNDITIMAVDRPGSTNQYHRLALESSGLSVSKLPLLWASTSREPTLFDSPAWSPYICCHTGLPHPYHCCIAGSCPRSGNQRVETLVSLPPRQGA